MRLEDLAVIGDPVAHSLSPELHNPAIRALGIEAQYVRLHLKPEEFIAALSHGLPPTAGIALGFDRLAMLAAGAPRIEDVLWLPLS